MSNKLDIITLDSSATSATSFNGPWTSQPLALTHALIATLSDAYPENIDAIFVHAPQTGDSDLYMSLLSRVCSRALDLGAKTIVLNGLSKAECLVKNLPYVGVETCTRNLRELLAEFGKVDTVEILNTPPALHTASEHVELLKIAYEKGWRRIIISSHPHHITRCFMTVINTMNSMKFWPEIYCLTTDGVAWNRTLYKPVLNSGKGGFRDDVEGPYPAHIKAELLRIDAYAKKPDGEKQFMRHATPAEFYQYMELRCAMAAESS